MIAPAGAALGDWSAVILAAGGSRRFGAQKLLANLGGEPVVVRTVRAVSSVGFGEVIVVAGADHAAIAAALAGIPCRIVSAADWDEGISASIRAGVMGMRRGSKGVFLFLGDMPLVPVGLCEKLALLAAGSDYAARTIYNNMPGHPVAFLAKAVADLAALNGDEGAASLLRGALDRLAYLETSDRGATLDVDTPEALAEAELLWKSRLTSATIDSAISSGDLPNP